MTLISCKYFDHIKKRRKMSQRQFKDFLFIWPTGQRVREEKENKRKTLNNSKTVVLIKDMKNSFRASLRKQGLFLKP